ncbi:hypothetical protein [Streptomyces antimycoticus]|uniref:hypothetical protein n=1 Tax=Streptomyces antimycoticus TaxID=68175 RepID=UPI0036E780E1
MPRPWRSGRARGGSAPTGLPRDFRWTRCCTRIASAAPSYGSSSWRPPRRRTRWAPSRYVAADVWNFVDEHCTLVATAYQEVERQLSWHRGNRYRIIVAALLDGTARVSDFPEAEEVLGLPERGRYAVVALEDTDASSRAPHPAAVCAGLRTVWHTAEGTAHAIVLLGIPGSGAVTGCTVFIGSLMVCYAALGG